MLFLEGRQAKARRLAFSPDGGLLASAAEDRTVVSVWGAVAGRHPADLGGHKDHVTCLAFNPTNATLATGDRRGNVLLWDAAAGRLLSPLPLAEGGSQTCLAFSPDGRLAAGRCRDFGGYAVRLVDVEGKDAEATELRGPERVVYCLAFSPDGLGLVAGTEAGAALWDLSARGIKAALPLPASSSVVRAAAFVPGGRLVALAVARGAALWDTAAGTARVAVEGR